MICWWSHHNNVIQIRNKNNDQPSFLYNDDKCTLFRMFIYVVQPISTPFLHTTTDYSLKNKQHLLFLCVLQCPKKPENLKASSEKNSSRAVVLDVSAHMLEKSIYSKNDHVESCKRRCWVWSRCQLFSLAAFDTNVSTFSVYFSSFLSLRMCGWVRMVFWYRPMCTCNSTCCLQTKTTSN